MKKERELTEEELDQVVGGSRAFKVEGKYDPKEGGGPAWPDPRQFKLRRVRGDDMPHVSE